MPFCEVSNIKNHSLQNKKNNYRKVFFCTPINGSLTVECALLLPLFFLAMVTLLSYVDVLRLQTIIGSSLCESGKELGMYAYASDTYLKESPIAECNTAACILYGKAQLSQDLKEEPLIGIKGGMAGISFVTSSYENHMVDLRTIVPYKFPITMIPLPAVIIENRCKVRAWTGYHGEIGGESECGTEEMVYVTANEGVYHEEVNCTYLVLSIRSVSVSSIGALRNVYGERYHPCEKCDCNYNYGSYYITDKGNKYHGQKGCSGLKRTVRLVKKSSVGQLRKCSRC